MSRVNYTISYTSQPNVIIPDNAKQLPRELDNIGKAYVLHEDGKTTIYLNYSVGIKIDKPQVFSIKREGDLLVISVKRPNVGVKNKINYHFFKLEFDTIIEKVSLQEMYE
ncbi:hypothetical protein [Priestia aryabhattai]